jgi:hypothetical protein
VGKALEFSARLWGIHRAPGLFSKLANAPDLQRNFKLAKMGTHGPDTNLQLSRDIGGFNAARQQMEDFGLAGAE